MQKTMQAMRQEAHSASGVEAAPASSVKLEFPFYHEMQVEVKKLKSLIWSIMGQKFIHLVTRRHDYTTPSNHYFALSTGLPSRTCRSWRRSFTF